MLVHAAAEREREISLPSETPLPLIEFYLLINAHGESVRGDVDSLCISCIFAPFFFLFPNLEFSDTFSVFGESKEKSINARVGYSTRDRKDRNLH